MDFAKHALALPSSLTLATCATTGGNAPGSPRTLIGPEWIVEGTKLEIENAGVTRRACAPAVMDQEQRFPGLFNTVNSYRIDETGALALVTAAGTTITARTAAATK